MQESGYIKNLGVKDAETQVAQGSYSYTGPDGIPVSISYTADENGFQAFGSHIPTPVPLPKVSWKLQCVADPTSYHSFKLVQWF